jgi:hypothetical protein
MRIGKAPESSGRERPLEVACLRMEVLRDFEILPQPDETSCGPTCLHSIYRHFGDDLPLQDVIRETPSLGSGGTLLVFLASHALARGYSATIYTYNLQVFDPTWFEGIEARRDLDLADRLQTQVTAKKDSRLAMATKGYLNFLGQGGRIRFQDLSTGLIRKYLTRGIPILTGLSATYLYRSPREFGPKDDFDDIRGEPSGHFVVLHGYEKESRQVLIADPYPKNPFSADLLYYRINIERVICAILLGIVTYDANLLIIEPRRPQARADHGRDQSHRR